jgi:SAM-dependent methyltransferase
VAGVDELLRVWRDDLNAWAIPEEIRKLTEHSPWETPRSVFASRARRGVAAPSGVSYERAREALPPAGSVLAVGCGAGAASLPLAIDGVRAVGVDVEPGMLAEFVALAASAARRVEAVVGRWPDVARTVAQADVAVCHHVLYNIAELAPFVVTLTEHARRRVVVELTARHPMSDLNPLWERLHGLRRSTRPTAADAVALIRALGFDARCAGWTRPAMADFASYDEMLDVTARRLCPTPDRRSELDSALRDLGVDPSSPRLGPPEREMMTIWWPGAP